jgi:hypothetical protein
MGAWMLYGTTVQAISSPDPNNAYQSAVDGTWQYANFATPVSGGQVQTNNLICAAFLIQRNNDPIFGSNTIVLMYQGDAAGGKWWNLNYGAVTRVTTAFVNNVPALFAYIGNQLFQLLANPASSPASVVKTALWDFDDPITAKECIRGGIGISANGGTGIQLFLDTPRSSQPFAISTVGQVVWVNSSNATVTWQNNALQTVTWIAGQFQTYWGQAPQGDAKYVGFTFQSTQGTQFEINTFLLDYKWKQAWAGN